jgi:putative phosphoribosyl transferase
MMLALPRGGVPVGIDVGRARNAPLDIFIVYKLRVPGHEELAVGVIAPRSARLLNPDVIDSLGVSPEQIEGSQPAKHRNANGASSFIEETGSRRTTILVDVGPAAGSSMRVVRAALRQKGARKIVGCCCCCQLPLRRLPARKPTAQFVLLLRSIPTLSAGGIDAFSRRRTRKFAI